MAKLFFYFFFTKHFEHIRKMQKENEKKEDWIR